MINKSPQAQDRSWFFLVDAPGYIRSLLPITTTTTTTTNNNNTTNTIENDDKESSNDNEWPSHVSTTSPSSSSSSFSSSYNYSYSHHLSSSSSMPVVLVADKKAGGLRAFDCKLQSPCSELLRPPAAIDINTPAFSSAALQQTHTVNIAQSFTLVGNNEIWVGWSSGHIGVYKMYTNEKTSNFTQGVYAKNTAAAAAAGSSIQNSKSRNIIHWKVITYLYRHRAAVHLIVTGAGPWVFTASHDHRLLQWHAETHEVIRDITNICCMQDDYRWATIRMMTVAMGCSSTTSFTHPRGHFILFFSTEKRVLYGVSLGGPARRNNRITDMEISLQRISSVRPTVTSAVVLVGSGDDDAAGVLCFGDDDGSITLTPLTVVYSDDNSNREQNTYAASKNSTNSTNTTNTNTNILSDGEYLRRVADAVLTADTLHVNKGRITALSMLSVTTDKTTGIMSYCLAAASFKNAITLFTVSVSPVIAGGHLSGCLLLSVLPTMSPVTSLAPLFTPVQQNTVATALMSFADGTAAVLFHFLSSIMQRKGDHYTQSNKNKNKKKKMNTKEEEITTTSATGMSIDLNSPRATTSMRMKNTQRRRNNNNNNNNIVELQERLRMTLQVVSDASTVAEEAEETLEKQQQELQQLHSAKEVLTRQVIQLAEALNKKSAEVISLKHQNDNDDGDHHNHNHNYGKREECTINGENTKKVQELEQRNRILVQQLEKCQKEKEEETKRLKETEMERDHIQTVLLESEARYQSDLDELLRENRFLAETLKQNGYEMHNETNGRNTHAYSGERESTVKVSERNKTSLRKLLENSLIMPESTVEADISLHGALLQRL